jgi:hypothetical protein
MGSHWRNRKVGWSVAETKAFLVAYRSFLWTVHAQQAVRDTIPPIFREVPVDGAQQIGDDLKPKSKERWKLGQLYNGAPGERLSAFQFAPTAQSINEQIQLVSKAIDELTTPRVSHEIGSGLEGAGFAISQVLAELRIRHDPICHGLEKMLEEVTRFAWHLVRTKVRESVWVFQQGDADVGWLSAGPDDLTESVSIDWEVNAETPSAEMIKARYAHERLHAGTIDLDGAIKILGDSPDEIREGKTRDRLRNTKWYMDYEDAAVLAELSRGDLLKQAAAVNNMIQSGNVPPNVAAMMGGGGPGGPGDVAAQAMGGPGGPAGAMPSAPPGQMGGGPPLGAAPGPGGTPGAGPGVVLPQAGAMAGVMGQLGPH